MYQMLVEVKNMFTGEVAKTEYIPMHSLFAATAYADKVRECADVASVMIIDQLTGEIAYDTRS